MTDVDLFEIETVDVRGVPTKTWKHAPHDLRAVWDGSLAHGENIYLVYASPTTGGTSEDQRFTYADAHRIVRAVADWMATEHGVRQGDRVAIAMRNYPEWVFTYWATIGLGAVAVPLNAWWTGPELAYGATDSGAKLVVVDEERAERLAGHAEVTVVRTPEWQKIVERTDAPALPDITIDPDTDAVIMYTSGTTGKPKGAVGTHRNATNFLHNGTYRTVTALQAAGIPADFVVPPPTTLLTFPLFHVGGLQSFLLPFTLSGGKIVLMYKWDAKQAVELCERENVTSFAGVPTTVFQLLEEAAAQGKELAALGGISSGATLVPPELVRRIDQQFASRAAPGNGYGLTETSGAAIANFGPAYVAKPESVGQAIAPVIELRIADPDGNEVPQGGVGEIWLKGPTVVRGYFGLDEATAAAFTDGWFHTGDVGRVDEDGDLFVVDRIKDMIIRGGENIYAAEIEAALYEHADITEAAIIGIPHDRLGEEVGAVIRVRDGAAVTETDVQDHVAARLAAFKVPVKVWIVHEELPRNASGKVLKRELRESLLK
ncbi:MAG: steroid-24-oyl-CoA synthetase [Actinomycetota bacterium]|nr:steroid-24-oyl-CoA synthetase [Actinomycetota bacterium]